MLRNLRSKRPYPEKQSILDNVELAMIERPTPAILPLTLTLLLGLPAWAEASQLGSQDDPATGSADLPLRYLEALYDQNLEALASLTSKDLLFRDSTSSALPSGPWRFEGRDAVLEFFRSSVEGIEDNGFELLRHFQAGDQTVLELTYWTRGDGTPLGAPGVSLHLRIPAVTVIRTKGGVVVEHQDFVDYPAMMRQVDRQVAAAKQAQPSSEDNDENTASPAVATDIDAIADSYLQAMWKMDYDGMAQHLAEEALYEDYTAEYFGIPPYHFYGKEAVLGFFRRVNADSSTETIEPSIRYRFSSGTNVLLLIDVNVKVDGEAWGAPDKTLTGSGLTVTWLRIQDGKVTRHIDYADYETAMSMFKAQGADR